MEGYSDVPCIFREEVKRDSCRATGQRRILLSGRPRARAGPVKGSFSFFPSACTAAVKRRGGCGRPLVTSPELAEDYRVRLRSLI